MQNVSLNTTTIVTLRPTAMVKETNWDGRTVKPVSSDSNCLAQKGIVFSNRIPPTQSSEIQLSQDVVIIYLEWACQEQEWRLADPPPYITAGGANLTELLEDTGYTFAIFDDCQIIECKKAKDRVVGWWKSGVKWVKEHKKEIIITTVALGAIGLGVGIALLATATAVETAVATGAAAGTAAAAGAGTRRKQEESEKPETPRAVASASPPPPPFIPVIDPLPSEKAPSSNERSALLPSYATTTPSIDFQPTHSKSPLIKDTDPVPTVFSASIDFTDPRLYYSQIQGDARTYFNYLIEHANHSSSQPSPTEAALFPSIFQTIQKGFAFLGAQVIDNVDLFHPDSPSDPFYQAYEDLMKEHNIPISPRPRSMPPFLSIAPVKSAYADFLNLLATYDSSRIQRPVPKQPSRSLYFTIEGTKSISTQVTFANGMGNHYLDGLSNGNYLKSMTHLQVEGIYNRTNGIPADLAEITALNLAGYSPITEELIMKKFIDFAEANKDDPHAKCLHACHSQSAIHTRNVLEKLPPEISNRVIVVNIAGARIIPNKLCYRSFNFVSEQDLVPHLQYLYNGWTIANLSEEEQQEIFDQEKVDAQEMIVLKAKDGAKGFEMNHSFQSPIYFGVLKELLVDYEMRKGKY